MASTTFRMCLRHCFFKDLFSAIRALPRRGSKDEIEAEDARWESEREKLTVALRRARN